MVKEPKRFMNEGLTHDEVRDYLDLLVKANMTQLHFMKKQISHELKRRGVDDVPE